MGHATAPDGARATGASSRAGVRAKGPSVDAPARPQACTVCQRADVAAINEALTVGRSASSIATSFFGARTAKDTIGRHARKCLNIVDQKAAKKQRTAASRRLERALNGIRVERVSLGSAAAVLDQHEVRYQAASEIFEQAMVLHDPRLAIEADKLRGAILDAAARLQGFDKSGSSILNVERMLMVDPNVSDEFLRRYIAAAEAGESVPQLAIGAAGMLTERTTMEGEVLA